MDSEELKRLKALADAATAGPWVPKYLKTLYIRSGEVEHHVRSTVTGVNVATIRFHSQSGEIGGDQEDRDVAFIAEARAAVPALLAEVERMKAVIAVKDAHAAEAAMALHEACNRSIADGSAMRERCAKVAETFTVGTPWAIAAAIRALPED